jgi:hypothetical protein
MALQTNVAYFIFLFLQALEDGFTRLFALGQ